MRERCRGNLSESWMNICADSKNLILSAHNWIFVMELSVSEEYRQVPISYSVFSMFIDLYNFAREHVALSQGDICSFVRDFRNRGKWMFAIESWNLLDLVKIR